ncbi:MAG: Na(+)-translocating NADH-quinone reductase subunit A [Cellvibrionaceae bacterium]
MIDIRKGLDLPISGEPEQSIAQGSTIRSVAIVGNDYHGMKPTMAVQVGDRVKLGQTLFSDKKNPKVLFTSPASGTVAAIHRGARRVLQSVVVDVDGDEQETFASHSVEELSGLSGEAVTDQLVSSGLWTSLRTRPFSKVPEPGTTPRSIFVTAMDTNPLAADPKVIIGEHTDAFNHGLAILTRLTEGKIFVNTSPNTDLGVKGSDKISVQQFSGSHPAGNAGTHIHFLDPVSLTKTVWTIGYQDVIAVGKLFTTGQLFVERVVSLAGPQVSKPQLVRTRLGASLDELAAGLLEAGNNRVVSGSVFGGRNAYGPYAYLGRYHNQITVLAEGTERPFLHYFQAGSNRFSKLPIYISKLFGGKKFEMTTSANGSERAMVPVGAYEKVMPLDILPTQLLRAIIVGDTAMAQQLGCLELDEEDLALCTFVCPGKYEYGPILRENLAKIEKEG